MWNRNLHFTVQSKENNYIKNKKREVYLYKIRCSSYSLKTPFKIKRKIVRIREISPQYFDSSSFFICNHCSSSSPIIRWPTRGDVGLWTEINYGEGDMVRSWWDEERRMDGGGRPETRRLYRRIRYRWLAFPTSQSW